MLVNQSEEIRRLKGTDCEHQRRTLVTIRAKGLRWKKVSHPKSSIARKRAHKAPSQAQEIEKLRRKSYSMRMVVETFFYWSDG